MSVPIRENGSVIGTLNGAIHQSNASFFPSLARQTDESQAIAVSTDDRTLYDSGNSFDGAITGSDEMEATGWTVTVSQDRSAVVESTTHLIVNQLFPLIIAFATLFGIVA